MTDKEWECLQRHSPVHRCVPVLMSPKGRNRNLLNFNKMIMIKEIIFMLMIASGQVQPMHEQNDGHELYVLCVDNEDATEQKDKVFCFEHAYKEEILEFIETGTFEYNEFLLTENQ